LARGLGLAQERVFDVPERMARSEEEVARRVLEVYQELEEECLRKEENGDEDEDEEDEDEEDGDEEDE
jgi:hypothetical protein